MKGKRERSRGGARIRERGATNEREAGRDILVKNEIEYWTCVNS